MARGARDRYELVNGVGRCSVPMWSDGLPRGACDAPAYGKPAPGRFTGYVPGLACEAHGGPSFSSSPAPVDAPAVPSFIDIVFDGPPAHESGRFVEVEDPKRASISVGEWIQRDDGYWVLRIPDPRRSAPSVDEGGLRSLLGMAYASLQSPTYDPRNGNTDSSGIDEGEVLHRRMMEQIKAGLDVSVVHETDTLENVLLDIDARWKAAGSPRSFGAVHSPEGGVVAFYLSHGAHHARYLHGTACGCALYIDSETGEVVGGVIRDAKLEGDRLKCRSIPVGPREAEQMREVCASYFDVLAAKWKAAIDKAGPMANPQYMRQCREQELEEQARAAAIRSLPVPDAREAEPSVTDLERELVAVFDAEGDSRSNRYWKALKEVRHDIRRRMELQPSPAPVPNGLGDALATLVKVLSTGACFKCGAEPGVDIDCDLCMALSAVEGQTS